MAYMIKTGDTCPCCGRPIETTDPHTLLNLSLLAELMGLPVPPEKDGVSDHD